jgi:hypothetical protein
MPIIQDHMGNFVELLTDHYGTPQYFAPNGEAVAVPLYKLAGDSFGGDLLDPALWTASLGTGGTATTNTGELVLSTGTTADNVTSVTSVTTAFFSGLAPNKLRIVVQLGDSGVANNTRRGGMFTATDGAFFELSGTTFSLVRRKGGVDTPIRNGFLNGQWGSTFSPGTTSHFYEIIYQPRQIIWIADQKTLHVYNSAAAIWTNTMHLPIRMENFNSGGSTTNVSMSCRLATAARFGIGDMEKKGTFQSGTTAATVIKRQTGNLHDITISAVSNNSQIILYDNTAASGKILFDTGAMPANTIPISLTMGGVHFNVGLTLAITGADSNCLVIWS